MGNLHFIWLGELPAWAAANIERWRVMNPDSEVVVHRDSSLLWEPWRPVFDCCPHIQGKSDLLRMSVLRRNGGWYADCDTVPLRPLSCLSIPDHRVILPPSHVHGHVNNHVLYIPDSWAGWGIVDAEIERGQWEPKYATYGSFLWDHVRESAPDLVFVPGAGVWTTGDADLDERVYALVASGGNPGIDVPELIAAHAGLVKDPGGAQDKEKVLRRAIDVSEGT